MNCRAQEYAVARNRIRLFLVMCLVSSGWTAAQAADERPGPPCIYGSRCGTLEVRHLGGRPQATDSLDLVSAGDSEHVVLRDLRPNPENTWKDQEVPPGRYKIRFGGLDWFGGHSFATATTVKVMARRTTRVDIRQRPYRMVRGEIEDRAGRAIPYVSVVIRLRSDPAQVLGVVRADRGGTFFFWLPVRARTTVDFVDPTGRYKSTREDVAAWGLRHAVTMVKRRGPADPPYDPRGHGEMQGQVSVSEFTDTIHRRTYLYAADAFTHWIAWGGIHDPSDEPGRPNVRFEDVPPGRYKVQLTDGQWVGGDSFQAARVFTVEPGRVTTFTGHVGPRGNVLLNVVNTRGVEMRSVLVEIFRRGRPNVVSRALSEDYYLGPTFENLPPGDYQIRLRDVAGRMVPRWVGGGRDRASAGVIRVRNQRTTTLKDIVVKTGLRPLTSPRVTGRAAVGSMVRGSAGRWSVAGLELRPQWFRDGRAIRGATGWSRRLAAADRGHRLTVRVTAARRGYGMVTAPSRPTAKVR